MHIMKTIGWIVVLLLVGTTCIGECSTDEKTVLKGAYRDQCKKPGHTFRAGFMYWYGPRLLQERWGLAVMGTVFEVEDTKHDLTGKTRKGKIRIHQLVYGKRIKNNDEFCFKNLVCNNGFDHLNNGDNVIVFMVKYEGNWAIPDFNDSDIRIGIKIQTFQDDIVQAVKRFIESGIIEKNDYKIWQKIDPIGLKRRIEIQEMQ